MGNRFDDSNNFTITEDNNIKKLMSHQITPQNALPWIEKYRPTTLEDIASHGEIIRTLDKLVEGNSLPHLLLYGPSGTGKTSAILAIARKLNGAHYKSMTLELNASDDRNISVVRDQIKDFASTKTFFDSRLKLVILDEADAMTSDAQAALRRVMEKYTQSTRFCLICNHINNISPAIQSRCTKFRFGPLSDSSVHSILKKIVQIENINITDDGLKAILDLGGGDMRRNINIIQATHMAFPDKIDSYEVYTCTGQPLKSHIQSMIEQMMNLDLKNCIESIRQLKISQGYALQDIITHVHKMLQMIQLDTNTQISLYKKLSDIEYRLAGGSNENIQLVAMISSFILARNQLDISIKKNSS